MTQKDNTLRFLISGGGTGGHIFPALSIADALRRRWPDCRILFVGAEGRMEMTRVPAAGYEIEGLPVAGFNRKNLLANVPVLWKLAKSMLKARRIVRQFRPDMAIGVGGYASGPTLKAAQRSGVPTLLQEQNSYAGVTNKLLSRRAEAICVAYPDLERFFPAERIVMTGNPVRSGLTGCTMSPGEARDLFGLKADGPLLLVVGGSLGARTVNESVIKALPALIEAGVNVLWQTGRLYAGECARVAADYPADRIKAMPFISQMAEAYRAATLVVARAGASTISELQLLGKSAILIPSPNVAEDHQTKNALALATRDAAVMIPDSEARDRLASEVIGLIGDNSRLERLGRNASAMALSDSDTKIVNTIQQILARHGKA